MFSFRNFKWPNKVWNGKLAIFYGYNFLKDAFLVWKAHDFCLQFTTTKCNLNEQICYCSTLEGRKKTPKAHALCSTAILFPGFG